MASSGAANATALRSVELKAALAAPGLIREDVMNKIFDISKIPLPFTDMVGSGTHKNAYVEWTTDELAAPLVTNQVMDGATISGNDTKLGLRVGNHSSIAIKAVEVSYRADSSDVIGRSKELAYQLMRRQQELRRDVEAMALSNTASLADTGAAAGKVGGLPTWIKTNTNRPVTMNVATQGFIPATKVTTAVAGTANLAATALKESEIRSVIQSVYTQGGDATVMMTTPGVVAQFSQYMLKSGAGVASVHGEVDGRSKDPVTALGAVNVFVTDFGTIRLVPNRLQPVQPSGDAAPVAGCAFVFFLDPQYLSLSYLRGYQTDELSKNSLTDRRVISVDWSLIVHTEKAHGMITIVNPAVAMVA